MSGNSDYEKARRANIARNNQKLTALGLQKLERSQPQRPQRARTSRKRKTATVKKEDLRRSSRTRNVAPQYTGEIIDNSMDVEDPIIQHKRTAKKKKMNTADVIEKQREWLDNHRQQLQSQYVNVKVEKNAKSNNSSWEKIAKEKWGQHVDTAFVAFTDLDWEQYVLSRTSSPSSETKYGLLQEEYQHCPWRLLISCVLMSRVSSVPVKTLAINSFFAKYPTPSDALDSDPADAFKILKSLGLFDNRYKSVIEISTTFLTMPTFACGLDKDINKIRGVGEFGVDSFNIFVRGEAHEMYPADKNLLAYCNWVRRSGTHL